MVLENDTLITMLARSAERFHSNFSLSLVNREPLTYADLYERVLVVSRMLRDQGIAVGDRVAILSENKPEWGIAYFAIAAAGAISVPILPEFHSSEVQHILRHAECKAIFISERYYQKIEGGSYTDLTTFILIDNFSIIPPETQKGMLKDVLAEGFKEFSRLRDSALRFVGWTPAEAKPDDVSTIIYTSGTTGHSKGVMLSHRNLLEDVKATAALVSIVPGDRMLSFLPLSHAYECTLGLVTPLSSGMSVYYLDKPPTPQVLVPAMQTVHPTIMLSVPLVIEKIFRGKILPQFTGGKLMRRIYRIPFARKRLHRLAGKKLLETFGGSLRLFCIGGAPLAPDVEKFLWEARFPYAIGYGLTETSPLVAGTDTAGTRFRATGPALPGIEIKIADPDLHTGEGEILVRGPVVMKGYYKDPERTREVITAEGWFHTGDLGVLESDGYLFIKGRLKNVILGASGENIYPEEIESVINEFEIVTESLVFAEQHQLAARVHLNYEMIERRCAEENLDESRITKKIEVLLLELREQVNARVSKFSQISRVIEQIEPFEKTPTQKIKRYLYA
jgi:long-chain acyl-CoA synthetase